MTLEQYQDSQELENEVRDYTEQIETLAEEQKDHQEDLEDLLEAWQMLSSSQGIYADSDSRLIEDVEIAITTRESSVETCKEKITEIKIQIETKVENLDNRIEKTEDRIGQMEGVANSLIHKNEGIVININNEIREQKEEVQDAKDKSTVWKKLIEFSELITATGVLAEGISQLIDWLKSAGLFR
jgi:chromosome segregation ATPase